MKRAVIAILCVALSQSSYSNTVIKVTMPSKWVIPITMSVSPSTRERNDFYCKCYDELDKCVKDLKALVKEDPKHDVESTLKSLKEIAGSVDWKHVKSGGPSYVEYGRKGLESKLKCLKMIHENINYARGTAAFVKQKNAPGGKDDNLPINVENGLPVNTRIIARNGDMYTCQLPDGTIRIVNSQQPLTAAGQSTVLLDNSFREGTSAWTLNPDTGELKEHKIPTVQRTKRERDAQMWTDIRNNALRERDKLENGLSSSMTMEEVNQVLTTRPRR